MLLCGNIRGLVVSAKCSFAFFVAFNINILYTIHNVLYFELQMFLSIHFFEDEEVVICISEVTTCKGKYHFLTFCYNCLQLLNIFESFYVVATHI